MFYCEPSVPSSFPKAIYLNNVGMDRDDLIHQINEIVQQQGTDNLQILDISKNNIVGILPHLPFPNLEKLYIYENQITGFEDDLAESFKNLREFIFNNNNIERFPNLPKGIKVVVCSNNTYTNFIPFPSSLKQLILQTNHTQTCSKELALTGLPYEIKKSLAILLKNPRFICDLTDRQKKEIYGFAKNERQRYYFEHGLALKKPYYELHPNNLNNPIFEKLTKLFVLMNVREFLFN